MASTASLWKSKTASGFSFSGFFQENTLNLASQPPVSMMEESSLTSAAPIPELTTSLRPTTCRLASTTTNRASDPTTTPLSLTESQARAITEPTLQCRSTEASSLWLLHCQT